MQQNDRDGAGGTIRPHQEDEGTMLQAAGLIDAPSLARARRLAGEQGRRLIPTLLRMGLVAEDALASALAAGLGLERVRSEDFPARPLPDARISARFLRDRQVLPLEKGGDCLKVAMADPLDAYTREALSMLSGRPVVAAVAAAGEIEAAIGRLYGEEGEETVAGDEQPSGADRLILEEAGSAAPAIRYVNRLLAEAVRRGATDAHVEAVAEGLRCRLRVDGFLHVLDMPPAPAEAVLSRIKLLAGLDIAERRLPQDGRLSTTLEGRRIDLRVSVLPALHGESAVLRLLDRARTPLSLDQLGLSAHLTEGLRALAGQGSGILLVTGPTGSGKTTTLYALLDHLNRPERKIVTVEDPVEYRLDGITQVPVRPDIGVSFARSLRSILRHDPDILLIGEIRDAETARIAVQAALTGHLVLATLHTNDAPGAVLRLKDMGIEDYLLAATIGGIMAQRLVRRLKPGAGAARRDPPEFLRRLGIGAEEAAGLKQAAHDDFSGRFPIGELVCADDAFRRLIVAGSGEDLRCAALAGGMVPLGRDGLNRALAGETTIEEVLRAGGSLL